MEWNEATSVLIHIQFDFEAFQTWWEQSLFGEDCYLRTGQDGREGVGVGGVDG